MKTVLGWDIECTRLILYLPLDKFESWLNQITQIRSNMRCTMEELESLIGRLCHACYAIPLGNHFLNRLRAPMSRRKHKRSMIHLNNNQKEDLLLFEDLILKANEGISINNLIHRRPTQVCLLDSCPYGLGGFSCRSGRSWRLRIPPELVGKVSNNLLEFLAEVICIWISIIEGDMERQDCCLSFGDNTSAISWLHLSNFCDSDQIVHQSVARHLE